MRKEAVGSPSLVVLSWLKSELFHESMLVLVKKAWVFFPEIKVNNHEYPGFFLIDWHKVDVNFDRILASCVLSKSYCNEVQSPYDSLFL